MRKNSTTAGLLFMAAASVYTGGAITAIAADGAATTAPSQHQAEVRTDDQTTVVPVQVNTTPSATGEGKSVSSTDVAVSPAGTVEIHVDDASLVQVLRMLSLQSQRNIIASKEVHGTVTANLYDVTIKEALDAILRANGYAYREKGNFIYVYSAKELAELEKSERKMQTEVFRLYYTPAANAVNMIKPVLSAESQTSFTTPASSGLESGTNDLGGSSHAGEDMLVITDYPDNLEKVRKIIKEIDRRPQQILIEATILRASLSEDNSLGVDFTVLGGVDFNALSAVNESSTTGTGLNQALTGSIMESGKAGAINDRGFVAGRAGGGGLNIGVVKNNVGVFVQALEGITDTVVLANPKVLALNKQKGEVIVGRKDGYMTSTTTESSTVQTVEFLETGTRLVFRPYIGDDGYIRMEIHPEDSSGGLAGQANLPFKITTEVTSNVMVKDGNTIVIGGLFREDSNTTRGQVPFLGNLPLAGALFRKQSDHTLREEVIILLTPHIVKDDAAYSSLSEEALKEAETLRVGVRQGMMPWGRERLAESSYESAVAEMKKPNPDRQRALWHLNCATNLNPKFIEAIHMKEMLTGHQVTAVDNSMIREFVAKAVLADRAVVPATQPIIEQQTPAADEPTTRTAKVDAPPATQPVATAAAKPPATQPVAMRSKFNPWGAFWRYFNSSSHHEQVAQRPTIKPKSAPAVTVVNELPAETDQAAVDLNK
ncbi:MAG: secretin and TonB N-terminal domain-containing protein [Phycisphaerales bacterium]|jgi:type IV pilus assembly protein PilQ|nr:secretin and TonB N-terminal domain-containing protein [Phycisphaerales bacterium]